MAYGRGGAGNIEAGIQKNTEDIEAQRLRANNGANHPSQPPSQPQPSNLNQDYAHTGRGGSGNWYSPKDLQQTDYRAKAQTKAEVPPEYRRTGRGGAGNFQWDEESGEKKDEVREIELKEMVVKDVEAGLPRPDRAVLRGLEE